LIDPVEEAHPQKRRSQGRVLTWRPAEVALVAGPERVEAKANRAIEGKEKPKEKARGARPAVEEEEERREGNRIQELKKAQVEMGAVGETHRKPARGRDPSMVVRQGTARAPEDPGEREGEAEQIEEGEKLATRQPLASADPPSTGQPTQKSAERGHAPPELEQDHRVLAQLARFVENDVEEMGAHEAEEDRPCHEARSEIRVEASASGAPDDDFVAHDDRDADENLEGGDLEAAQREDGLFDVGKHRARESTHAGPALVGGVPSRVGSPNRTLLAGGTAMANPRPAAHEDLVLYSANSGVATLTLNRPQRLNAWTPALSTCYFDLLERADDDPNVRAIVVTGAGRGFTAGADMDVLQGSESAPRPDARQQTFPLSIRKPILAAINGPCAGIGLVLALMCDVRFAAAGAKFTTAFSRRGLVAEHGISWILPRLIGHARALDLLYSGRVFLAEEALSLGLVNRVVAPEVLLEETLAYARELVAHCSPAALAEIKRQVYGAYESDLATAVSVANRLMVESFGRPDFKEGVTSFLEKRPPVFPPLPPRSTSRHS